MVTKIADVGEQTTGSKLKENRLDDETYFGEGYSGSGEDKSESMMMQSTNQWEAANLILWTGM